MSNVQVSRVYNLAAIRRFEFCFAVLGLLFYSGGITNILTSNGVSSFATPIRYFILLGSLCGILVDRQKLINALSYGRWLWPLVLFTVASFAWSVDPIVTIQGLRSDFIPISIFGLYLAIRFSQQEVFQSIYATVLIASIASLFYVFIFPSVARHPLNHEFFPGAWKGIFSHKNALGVNLSITNICVGLKIFFGSKKYLAKNILIYIFIMVEAIFAQSVSSFIVSIFTIAIVYFYPKYVWKGKVTALILYCLSGLAIAISVAVASAWTPLMLALGRDPTLSARTLIWEHVMSQHVAQKPLLGFGRGVFWSMPSIYRGLYEAAYHIPSHAHNGYVELLLDLGYVGLLLLFLALLTVLARTLNLAYRSKNPVDLWPLALLVLLMLNNLTESVLLRGASFLWLLLVTISCMPLSKERFESSQFDNRTHRIISKN